jgi:hypothetical protein
MNASGDISSTELTLEKGNDALFLALIYRLFLLF